MRYWISLVLPLIFIYQSYSQFSAHPSGLQWKQINTKRFKLLYPESISGQAKEIAQTIDDVITKDSALGTKAFKINIVLQNQTTVSNGYVSIGPFLSEFYLTPPHLTYVTGAADWSKLLAIHEYRHVQQAMNSRVGINKFLYNILGEEAWAVSHNLVLPDWFSEGDAVYAETEYTNGGRGRMASFSMDWRRLAMDKKLWPYAKMRNGSFKHLVPNQYTLGYPMVKYIYDQYGSQGWRAIYDDAIRYKPFLFSFSKALKKHIGLSTKALYHVVKTEVQTQISNKINTDKILLTNTRKQKIKEYNTPHRLSNGSLLFIEKSNDKNPTVYLDQNGKKKTLFKMGITTSFNIGFSEPLITWSELTTDARWSNRDYSDIWCYNLYTKEKKRLTHKQKLFSPQPSIDSKLITSMEYLPDGKSNIHIMDLSGKLIKRIELNNNNLATYPNFLPGDTSIVAIIRGNGYSSILKYNIYNNRYEVVLPPVPQNMANLSVNTDTIYFSSDINGVDNIYAKIFGHDDVYQITDHNIGIQQYSILGNELVYNVPHSKGIEIRSIPLDSIKPTVTTLFTEKSVSLEQRNVKDKASLAESYEVKKAGLLNNPFKVYSWSLRPDEGGNTFSILGRNILNTIDGNVSYTFNTEDNSSLISSRISLGTLYPTITYVSGYSFGRSIKKPSSPNIDSIQWNESINRIGIGIPWSIYHRDQSLSFQPFVQFTLYDPMYKLGFRNTFQTTQSIRAGFQFSNRRIRALQHVSSRWYQFISLSYNKALNHRAQSFGLNSEFNIPGIGKNHVIELGFDFNSQRLNDPYRFSNVAQFIRGYQSFSSDRTDWQRVAYHLPIAYPDLGIDGIYFLKRIRARVFFENANYFLRGTRSNLTVQYQTVGSEILFDGNIFNVLPISIGGRFNQPLKTDLILRQKKPTFEFLVEQLF